MKTRIGIVPVLLVFAFSVSSQAGLLSGNSPKPGPAASGKPADAGKPGKPTNAEKSGKSDASKTSDEEILEELKGFSSSFPTFEQANRIVEIAENCDRIAIQDPLFKAAGMAFASLGRMKPYKRFRNRIGILAKFETGVILTCSKCNGSGSRKGAETSLCEVCNGSGLVSPNRDQARQRAREWLEKGIHQIEYRVERDRKEKEEEERRAEEKRRAEAFAAEQRAKGLVLYNGRWMTPAQRDEATKYERFRAFIMHRSKVNARFEILQIIGSGRALCIDAQTGDVFCLHYSMDSAENRAVVEGQKFTNNLYWGGTYSYTTVQNAPKRVALFAIDYSEADQEAIKQGFLED